MAKVLKVLIGSYNGACVFSKYFWAMLTVVYCRLLIDWPLFSFWSMTSKILWLLYIRLCRISSLHQFLTLNSPKALSLLLYRLHSQMVIENMKNGLLQLQYSHQVGSWLDILLSRYWKERPSFLLKSLSSFRGLHVIYKKGQTQRLRHGKGRLERADNVWFCLVCIWFSKASHPLQTKLLWDFFSRWGVCKQAVLTQTNQEAHKNRKK